MDENLDSVQSYSFVLVTRTLHLYWARAVEPSEILLK
jgi:hypothetical protein